ncbi:MAG: membrane protein insertion efficiency factor YidD [Lentisphaerae bacterium GWF2_52_8]|nr:MAG: membrane protein insertion efficiency factor YidD [Lentisphaerae bacterium GWF2_52_8]
MSKPSLLAYLLIGSVKLYRICLSPLVPPCCRFTPSCSEYALEALYRHGALQGGLLAVWRILRCQPWCDGGCDPVPEKLERRFWNTLKTN